MANFAKMETVSIVERERKRERDGFANDRHLARFKALKAVDKDY